MAPTGRRRLLLVAVFAVVLLLTPPPSAGARHSATPAAVGGDARGGSLGGHRRRGWAARAPALTVLALSSAPGAAAESLGAFRDIDTNQDGMVDRMEYMYAERDALDRRGVSKDKRAVDYDVSGKLYDAADVDHDGMLSLVEWEYRGYLNAQENALIEAGASVPPPEGPDFGASLSKEALKHFDKNSDTRVDLPEFTVACQRMAGPGLQFITPEHDGDMDTVARKLFDLADVDADGALDWEEYRFAGWIIAEHVVTEAMRHLMTSFDLDRDGHIRMSEVERRIDDLSGARDRQRLREAKRVRKGFEKADGDGNGLLDEAECKLLAMREIIGKQRR